MVTWSVEGLINEYRDDCEILKNGQIKIVKGMDGLEEVLVKSLDKKLEAFYTSGGASHTIRDMMSRGVKNCSYKTLRYKGHQEVVRFLIRDSELTDECLSQVFLNGCRVGPDKGDMVVVKAQVSGGDVHWEKEVLVYSGPHKDVEFSAMQKATAFPASSVASLMAEGYFDNREIEHRGYKEKLPVVLSYKDIPFEKFDQNLKLLGLDV
jgi:saccharopine dehydrogenase-like NADP-dependent oxidoreductase